MEKWAIKELIDSTDYLILYPSKLEKLVDNTDLDVQKAMWICEPQAAGKLLNTCTSNIYIWPKV